MQRSTYASPTTIRTKTNQIWEICSMVAAILLLKATTATAKPTDPIGLEHCVIVTTVDCGKQACPAYISNVCGICIHAQFNVPLRIDTGPITEVNLPEYGDIDGSLSPASTNQFKLAKLGACTAGGPTFETRRRVLNELRTANELNGPFSLTRPMTPQELQGSRAGVKEVNFHNSFQVRNSEFIFRYFRRIWTKREIVGVPGSVKEIEDINELKMTAYLEELKPTVSMKAGELTSKESGLDVNVPGQILTVSCKKPGCLQFNSEKPKKAAGKVDQVSFFVKDLNYAKAAKGAIRELIFMDAQNWATP